MAAYKQRCADVFGALSLPQGSSLTQTSSLNPEEHYLSTSGTKEESLGRSVRDDRSRNDSHSCTGDYSDGPAMDIVRSGCHRGPPEGSGGYVRQYTSGRDGWERESRVAVVRGGGQRESPLQGCRSERGGRYRGGRDRRCQGRSHGTAPDYVVHPQHWTKYDLNDDRASDSVSDMSEEQRNTFAALQFLEDLRAQKRGGQEKNEDSLDEEESSSCTVVFRKPVAPAAPQTMECGREGVKATWNHARILPEYQVGSKLARKRKPISASSMPFEEEEGKSASSCDSSSIGVQLRHLCEQGEEEEGEQSCDSHMTHGKELQQHVGDIDRVHDSSELCEPPHTGCLQLPSHCEEEQEERKVLFKKSGKRKKQGQRRVTDAELD